MSWETLPKGMKVCANPGCNREFRQYRTTDRDCSKKCYLERTKQKRAKRSQIARERDASQNRYQGLTLPQRQLELATGLQGHTESEARGSKFGWIAFGDRKFYMRSSWERNYARYLEFVKQHGDIKDWDYECQVFEFKERHGTTRYLPDFKIIRSDGTHYWVEVKGHMKQKDRTKLKRMKRDYPEEVVELLDGHAYRELAKTCSSLIPEWE